MREMRWPGNDAISVNAAIRRREVGTTRPQRYRHRRSHRPQLRNREADFGALLGAHIGKHNARDTGLGGTGIMCMLRFPRGPVD